MKLNRNNDLLIIKSNGDLKLYDIENKKLKIDENIMFLLKENMTQINNFTNSPYRGMRDPIENVYLDNNSVPIIYFKSQNVYLFN